MKKYIFTLFTLAISFNLFSQNKINLQINNGNTIEFSESEFKNNSKEKIELQVQEQISNVKEYSFPPSEVTGLNETQNAQNTLSRIVFLSQSNSAILTDIEAQQSGKTFYATIPYLTDQELNNLIAYYEATGNVFVSYGENSPYILQQNNKSSNDYLNNSCCNDEDYGTLQYILMDENKNINKYQVCLRNNRLPVLKISGNGAIGGDWKENYTVTFENSQADSKVKYSTKNLHYKIKLEEDLNSIYGKTGNRWTLYPISHVGSNKNLMQERIFCSGLLLRLANEVIDYSWNPSTYPTELIVNEEYLGTYWLTEEIRASKNKVADGVIFELVDKADNDEVFFKTKYGEITCKLHDPELNYEDQNFIYSKKLIENFEKALFIKQSNNTGYKAFIDMESFADWYILHELAKVESNDIKSDCYVTAVLEKNKLQMGPVSHFYSQFGNSGESYEGFALKSNAWFNELLKDQEFLSMAIERLNKIKNSDLLGVITNLSTQMRYLISNQSNKFENWGKTTTQNNAKNAATDFYENWLLKRIEWLEYALNQELSIVTKKNSNNQNQITAFSLKMSNNPNAILEDYTATIKNDSILIYIPYLVNFDLKPTFTTTGKNVYHNGFTVTSNESIINFSKEEVFTVVDQSGNSRNYVVKIYNSGIPVIFIDTENKKSINSKTEWVSNSSMKVYEKDGTLNYSSGSDYMNIKGRGNSTWDASNKKPYAIKLNKKSKILGMLEDKRWVMLANHYDRSFIRAGLASWLGKRLTNQDWTPSGYSTEVVLNGKHVGNYFFCEKIKISDDRVNADYLLEVDSKAKSVGGYDDVYFRTQKTDNVFNIKDPEISNNGTEFNYVQNYINEVEQVLYDDSKYLDATNGYKKYCDLESFVDWSLIKELSKDYDGNFFTSCQMNLTDGILKMGPLWDFDLAFANNPFAEMFGGGFGGFGGFGGGGGTDYEYYNEPEGYHVLDADWLVRMMKDPEFRSLMLKKVNLLIEHEAEIDQYIDEQAALNINSFVVNETMWKTLGGSSFGWNSSSWNYTEESLRQHYRDDISKMKKFIKDRLAWMKKDLESR